MSHCRICRDAPTAGPALPHEPRPIFRLSASARILIASQAPGARAHASGVPFLDPSGTRLRAWMGVTDAEFYDTRRVAILPMGFCFPGYDSAGGDLPPRRECAPAWRTTALAAMPAVALILLVGSYAQRWHLAKRPLTATVADWRAILAAPQMPRMLPMPHPSWRNNGWLKRNPWFEAEAVPALRGHVRRLLG